MACRRWWAAGPVGVAVLLALAGCAIHDAARTDQALGRALSVNAWVDPGLAPLAGCAALDGEWSNRGNLVRDQGIKPSLLAAAIGLADDNTDAAFADTARFARMDDGGLALSLFAAGREVAAVRFPPAVLQCEDPSFVRIDYHGGRRLAVDASGALWIEEHRFPRTGTPACPPADFWGHSAPDGLATVVPAGLAVLWDSETGDMARVDDAITGVNVPPLGSFWLPGQHDLPARVTFKAPSQWALRLDTIVAEVAASLEPCHVYALFGHSTAPDAATLSVYDLGDDFAWRDCPLTETRGGRAPVFDGRDLVLTEACFGVQRKDWYERIKGPPRRVGPLAQVALRPGDPAP